MSSVYAIVVDTLRITMVMVLKICMLQILLQYAFVYRYIRARCAVTPVPIICTMKTCLWNIFRLVWLLINYYQSYYTDYYTKKHISLILSRLWCLEKGLICWTILYDFIHALNWFFFIVITCVIMDVECFNNKGLQ